MDTFFNWFGDLFGTPRTEEILRNLRKESGTMYNYSKTTRTSENASPELVSLVNALKGLNDLEASTFEIDIRTWITEQDNSQNIIVLAAFLSCVRAKNNLYTPETTTEETPAGGEPTVNLTQGDIDQWS